MVAMEGKQMESLFISDNYVLLVVLQDESHLIFSQPFMEK